MDTEQAIQCILDAYDLEELLFELADAGVLESVLPYLSHITLEEVYDGLDEGT